ncbi:hypothetical protein NX059_007725 [Plenodomus lindquistii]|nr:hypothetical protein NX059_007725 [Plenodomus lindquistii]
MATTTTGDQKASKYYPASDEAIMKKSRKTPHPTKYRPALAPGTILILLSGPHRGKRVVLLRQLSQGTLLITGPFKANGVPLRRVNHRYVIATSTVVDVSGLDEEVIERVGGEEYWVREKKEEEEAFFGDTEGGEEVKREVDPQRVEDQKSVDRVVLQGVRRVEGLEGYLGGRFGLGGGERPHEMVF